MKVSSRPRTVAPLRHPQDQAAADQLADGEQLELLAEHAMVAFLRLFQLVQIGVEVLLAEERGGVEPLQLLAAGVVLPVGAGDAEQLEGADLAGVRNVRPAAQVDELALAIEAQGRILLQVVVDVLDLVALLEVGAQGRAPRRVGCSKRSNGSAASTIFFISSSMRGKSSSRIGGRRRRCRNRSRSRVAGRRPAGRRGRAA